MTDLTQIFGAAGFNPATITTPRYNFPAAYARLAEAGQEALYSRYGAGTLKKRPVINPLSGVHEKNNPGFSLYRGESGKIFWKDFRSETYGDLHDFMVQVVGEERACQEMGLCDTAMPTRPTNNTNNNNTHKRMLPANQHPEEVLVQRRQLMAKAIYHASQADSGEIRAYLNGRGITEEVPTECLYHPQQQMMVAAVKNVAGEFMAIHRTWLASRQKKMLGAVTGGAVRLAESTNGKLAVTEGIETGLSVQQATKLATWAALSSSGVANLKIPEVIREVYIFADLDPNGAGQKAAERLAMSLVAAGRLVWYVTPLDRPQSGDVPKVDFNDLLQADPSGLSIRQRLQVAKQARCPAKMPAKIEEEWRDPEPLQVKLKPVQPFDYELLPQSLRPWVADIAKRMQCPADFIAVAVMIALATVIGKKVAIQPKTRDDWLIVVNLWGLLVGRPSVMKSPALNEGLKPLEELERLAKERYKTQMADWQVGKEMQLMEIEAAKISAKKAIKDGRTDDAKSLLTRAMTENDQEEPIRRRSIVTDATVEKLGELLNQNPNGLLLKRDEIVSFLRNLDREDRAHERGFYLEAFNGDGHYTYDRIGRGTIEIDAVTLSMVGTIQPGRLAAYTHAALSMNQNDDGLMQRFQLAVYPDPITEWHYCDQWPDQEAKQQVLQRFQELEALSPVMEEPSDKLYALRFDPEAQEMFTEWLTALEQTIRSEDIHPAIESHLTKYRSLGPSLALIIHLASGHGLTPVCADATARAFAWCDYLRSHMERIYEAAIDQTHMAASSLLTKIESGKLPTTFKVRDVRQKGWVGLDTTPSIKAAIKLLEEHYYLKEVCDLRPLQGRPTTLYVANPKVMEARHKP